MALFRLLHRYDQQIKFLSSSEMSTQMTCSHSSTTRDHQPMGRAKTRTVTTAPSTQLLVPLPNLTTVQVAATSSSSQRTTVGDIRRTSRLSTRTTRTYRALSIHSSNEPSEKKETKKERWRRILRKEKNKQNENKILYQYI